MLQTLMNSCSFSPRGIPYIMYSSSSDLGIVILDSSLLCIPIVYTPRLDLGIEFFSPVPFLTNNVTRLK